MRSIQSTQYVDIMPETVSATADFVPGLYPPPTPAYCLAASTAAGPPVCPRVGAAKRASSVHASFDPTFRSP